MSNIVASEGNLENGGNTSFMGMPKEIVVDVGETQGLGPGVFSVVEKPSSSLEVCPPTPRYNL
jgi:hypothetical protein